MATLTMTRDVIDDPKYLWPDRRRAGVPVGAAIPLGGPSAVLGRLPDHAQIVLPHPCVSRAHARIFEEGGAFHLEDQGSRHGTRLNGLPVAGRVPLADGDQIQIIGYVFVFRA